MAESVTRRGERRGENCGLRRLKKGIESSQVEPSMSRELLPDVRMQHSHDPPTSEPFPCEQIFRASGLGQKYLRQQHATSECVAYAIFCVATCDSTCQSISCHIILGSLLDFMNCSRHVSRCRDILKHDCQAHFAKIFRFRGMRCPLTSHCKDTHKSSNVASTDNVVSARNNRDERRHMTLQERGILTLTVNPPL